MAILDAEAALNDFRVAQEPETLAYIRRNTNIHDRMPKSVMAFLLNRESTREYMIEILESAAAQYQHIFGEFGEEAAQRWWDWFQMKSEENPLRNAA